MIKYYENLNSVEYYDLQQWFIDYIEKHKKDLLSGEKKVLVRSRNLIHNWSLAIKSNDLGAIKFVVVLNEYNELKEHRVGLDYREIAIIFIKALVEFKRIIEFE